MDGHLLADRPARLQLLPTSQLTDPVRGRNGCNATCGRSSFCAVLHWNMAFHGIIDVDLWEALVLEIARL